MTLADSIEWLGLSTEDLDGGYEPIMPIFGSEDNAVSGVDLPPFDTTLTRGQRNGAIGGAQWAREAVMQARLLVMDEQRLLQLRQAMKNRPRPDDEQPLKCEGFAFPEPWRMWVRPTLCQYRLGAGNLGASLFVVDCAWTSTDGLIYSEQQATEAFSGTSDSVVVENEGYEVGTAGRAVEVTLTAAGGSVVSPRIRFTHEDSSWEQITFQGLTLTSGQTLTIAGDRYPRVGTSIVSGYIRSTTNRGGPSRAAHWWRFPPGESTVAINATSGSFTGSIKTRSVW